MPNGDHGPPYHSEQPSFSSRLYADAKERIRLLKLEVAEARRCPGCGASAGTVHMGCVVCDQRSRAEKAEAERDELKQDVLAHRTNADAWKRSCKEAEAEVARLRAVISAKDELLTAYRIGSHAKADRALAKLEALAPKEDA